MNSPGNPIALAIEAWKTKLLDLSKRNRLVNFKVNKVSTVTIVDEIPGEVFRHLYIEERPMNFLANQDEAASDDDIRPEDAEELWLTEEYSRSRTEVSLYEPADLHARHTDDKLQTDLPEDRLDKALRRMEEQARLMLEEQGVNTLFITLGMLYYKESPQSEDVFRGPLVLLPVELARKSARTPFELRVGDDEPMINPALAERVKQIGLDLPQLPEEIPEDFNLQSLFAQINKAIDNRPGWRLTDEIFLCPLSFQKFVMYKDLQKHHAAISKHTLIQQLVGRTGTEIVGLPSEFRNMDLDAQFPPEKTYQVVDADSSQLRAMAAVQAGRDLVIEGPPGTGKSQTITNLIAQALSQGKTVLFVAEKMAALSVVHERLRKANLDEFCLELHSSKSNKRLVMQSLANALDSSLKKVQTDATATQRLGAARVSLTEYAQSLHEPYGNLGISPFRGFGELGRVRNAPLFVLQRNISDITNARLSDTTRDLEDLATAANALGIAVAEHPLRDSRRTFYSDLELQELEQSTKKAVEALSAVMTAANRLSERCGLPSIANRAEIDAAISVAEIIASSPGAPEAVVRSDHWNAPPPLASQLIEAGREFRRLKARVALWFDESVMDQRHHEDIKYVEQKKSGFAGFFAFLDARYRAIAGRWKGYRRSEYRKSILEQAHDLKSVDDLLARKAELRSHEPDARDLFGGLWVGEGSDWDALSHYVEWVVRFRRACIEHRLQDQAFELATHARPDVSVAAELKSAVQAADKALAELEEFVKWPPGYLAQETFGATAARLQYLNANTHLAPGWGNFEHIRASVSQGIAADLLQHAMKGAVAFSELAATFERAFFTKWLSEAIQARPPLVRFQGLTHEQRIREFRELDRRVLQENRLRLVDKLRDQTQDRLREPKAIEGMPHLRRELNKQRAIKPLRRTMAQAGNTIRAIKPCFLMSPLTAAQLLDGSQPSFDLVIFDEASQLPPEDAIGSIIRGRQLVVVGDPKQLPPTNFFAIASGQVTAPVDENGDPVYDDAESILEQFMGVGVPMSRLKWHYRSAHESLITFSNIRFYDADLNTFPCTDHPCAGLEFLHLSDARYEGAGVNPIEARAVAEAVMRFAADQLRLPEERRQSLAVGTFNIRQQLAIQDALEISRRSRPEVEEFFSLETREPFFVKNLENIQGDERDTVFLSVTYGRGIDGRVRNNFGALNSENGWRRLNVIISRARRHMRVFSSIVAEDINPAGSTSGGPQLLREFLTYAQHRRLDIPVVNASADAESPFEREVIKELSNRGYQLISQVGTAGYRIDIGVLDAEQPGRFVCGIECDGMAYHSAETARDRDRLREEVLRARGWAIHRVWSTDWFRDPKGQMDRLVRLIEQSRSLRPIASETASEPHIPSQTEEKAPAAPPESPSYSRPTAALYRRADGAGKYAHRSLLDENIDLVARELASIVDVESPVHFMEAAARLAGLWSTRLGRRIQAQIDEAMRLAERKRLIRRKGDFLWNSSDEVHVRSRAGMGNTPADRIPPDEIRQAVLAVLGNAHSFSRDMLGTEVRAMLGFDRMGAQLQTVITSAIDDLLELNVLGEGAAGICLRDV